MKIKNQYRGKLKKSIIIENQESIKQYQKKYRNENQESLRECIRENIKLKICDKRNENERNRRRIDDQLSINLIYLRSRTYRMLLKVTQNVKKTNRNF